MYYGRNSGNMDKRREFVMNSHLEKIADTAAPVAWSVWIVSHIAEINAVLQGVALLAAIFGTLAAGIFHITKTVLMWRNRHRK